MEYLLFQIHQVIAHIPRLVIFNLCLLSFSTFRNEPSVFDSDLPCAAS